jgi:MFS family permease
LKQDHEGRYKWVVFGAICTTYFLVFSQRTAPGLITDQLMQQFGIAASTLGVLTGIQYFAYMSLQIPLGFYADRIGPNPFLILGTLLDGIGTCLYSIAPNEATLLGARVTVGIGDAMIWINIVLVLSQWFGPREFAGLLGWTGMSGSLGAILTSVPLSYWINYAGWRIPFFALGVVLCLCSFANYLILTKGKKRVQPKPVREKLSPVIGRVVRSRQAWGAFLCHFGLVGTYLSFVGSWAIPYGIDVYGMSRTTASELVTVGLLGALSGGPVIGLISDYFKKRKSPYIVIHAITFTCWLFLVLSGGHPPQWLLWIVYLLIGFGNGASTLTFAVIRESFLSSEVGIVSGFANTGGFLSAVLLPTLFGVMLDHFGTQSNSLSASVAMGYQYGLIVPAVFSLIGLIGGFVIVEPKRTSHSDVQRTPMMHVSVSK